MVGFWWCVVFPEAMCNTLRGKLRGGEFDERLSFRGRPSDKSIPESIEPDDPQQPREMVFVLFVRVKLRGDLNRVVLSVPLRNQDSHLLDMLQGHDSGHVASVPDNVTQGDEPGESPSRVTLRAAPNLYEDTAL